MGCGNSQVDPVALAHSKDIDKSLREDKKKMNQQIKLLLLGKYINYK